MTNKGASRDRIELFLFDQDTKREQVVETDPRGRAALAYAGFSEKTRELIETMYVDDYHLQYWMDKERADDYRWLEQQMPGKEFQFASHTSDENLYVIVTHSDLEPGETLLYNRRAKTLRFQDRNGDKIPREYL